MMARKVPGTWSMAQAEEIERLKTQRDDLLAALRSMVDYFDDDDEEAKPLFSIDDMRALIAKAEGKAP